jgi:hypothetical protein
LGISGGKEARGGEEGTFDIGTIPEAEDAQAWVFDR